MIICKQESCPQAEQAVEKSKTGVDVCRNVPNVVFHLFIIALDRIFNFIDGVENGGVVSAEFLADLRQAEVGQLTDQVNGDLTGFVGALIFQGAAHDAFRHLPF